MPAFGPPSTVVVGTPSATKRSAAAWRATLIHEHFHQYQSALPRYYDRVNALGLSRGDVQDVLRRHGIADDPSLQLTRLARRRAEQSLRGRKFD